MDFKNILTKLDQLNESVEVVAEEAESENQAIAARIALKHKEEGTKPKAGTASAEMMKMSKGDLKDFTKAKKGAPKKKEESFDAKSFRESFEAMVEAKGKKPNDGNLANNAKPYDKVTRADVIAGATGNDEMGGKKKKKKADESVEEGKYKSDAQRKAIHASKDKEKKKNESVNESFEKFLSKEAMSFEEMVSIVQESGGQQKIDPIDDVLWQWANRVASSKGEGEMFAAKIYESNGGRFELHDVLSED